VLLSTAVLLLLLLLLLLLCFELQQHHEAHIVPQVKIVEVQLVNGSSLKAAGTPAGTRDTCNQGSNVSKLNYKRF
jgi:hypothetical protein